MNMLQKVMRDLPCFKDVRSDVVDDVDLLNVSAKIAVDWRSEHVLCIDGHGDGTLGVIQYERWRYFPLGFIDPASKSFSISSRA